MLAVILMLITRHLVLRRFWGKFWRNPICWYNLETYTLQRYYCNMELCFFLLAITILVGIPRTDISYMHRWARHSQPRFKFDREPIPVLGNLILEPNSPRTHRMHMFMWQLVTGRVSLAPPHVTCMRHSTGKWIGPVWLLLLCNFLVDLVHSKCSQLSRYLECRGELWRLDRPADAIRTSKTSQGGVPIMEVLFDIDNNLWTISSKQSEHIMLSHLIGFFYPRYVSSDAWRLGPSLRWTTCCFLRAFKSANTCPCLSRISSMPLPALMTPRQITKSIRRIW